MESILCYDIYMFKVCFTGLISLLAVGLLLLQPGYTQTLVKEFNMMYHLLDEMDQTHVMPADQRHALREQVDDMHTRMLTRMTENGGNINSLKDTDMFDQVSTLYHQVVQQYESTQGNSQNSSSAPAVDTPAGD